MIGGTIGALIGLGGALVITPILVIVLGVPIHYAFGASLVAIICTSSASSLVSLSSHGLTKEKLGLFLALATAIGAIIGAKLSLLLNSKTLFLIFGSMLIVVACLSSIKKEDNLTDDDYEASNLSVKLQLNDSITVSGETYYYKIHNITVGFLSMTFAGFISGLLGIGAGVFKVIGMDRIMKIPFKVSASTSNFIMGITALSGASAYYFAGYINSTISLPVALGTLLGATIGSKLMPIIPSNILRTIFFVIIFIAAIQMFFKGLM